MSIRISVVAQHRLIGESLAALVRSIKSLRVIPTVINIDEFMKSGSSRRSDIVLIDCDLLKPKQELLRQLTRVYPAVPILALASEYTDSGLLDLLGSGAASVVSRDADPAELHLAIKTIAKGGTYLSRILGEHESGLLTLSRTSAEALRKLTARQLQVLQLLAEGYATKEIADKLALSPRTIESHRSHIMERLGVRHLAGLVQYAIRMGIVSTG
jgi:DNA-binding NarL/FixJ family response regulator